jgi:hypothetical protein
MLKTMFEIIATMADDPDGYRSDMRTKLLETADTMPLAPMAAARERKVRAFVKKTVGNLLINQRPNWVGAAGPGSAAAQKIIRAEDPSDLVRRSKTMEHTSQPRSKATSLRVTLSLVLVHNQTNYQHQCSGASTGLH